MSPPPPHTKGGGGGAKAPLTDHKQQTTQTQTQTQTRPIDRARTCKYKTLITKRRYNPRSWPVDMMAWKVVFASTIVSLAFEPGAIKQVEDGDLTDDEAYILLERSVRESNKLAPPSVDFKTVPSERGWALLEIRSAKQFVAFLLQDDDGLGLFEDHCNIAAPEPSAPQDTNIENLDSMPTEHAHETALDILERRQQRVDACNKILEGDALLKLADSHGVLLAQPRDGVAVQPPSPRRGPLSGLLLRASGAGRGAPRRRLPPSAAAGRPPRDVRSQRVERA